MQRFLYILGIVLTVSVGCGSQKGSNALSTACPANKSKNKAVTASNLDAGSGIVLKNKDDPALGMGYWDATGTSSNGTKVTRRCTINLTKHPSRPDLVRVFTAKHCNFAPESNEFATAVSTFHLWANGGYFAVPVEFELREEFAAFASAGAPLLQAAGGESGADKWSRETGIGAAAQCKLETTANMQSLSAGQRLACASTSDLVNLDARISVPEKYKTLYTQVLEAVAKRNENILVLPARERELFNAVQSTGNVQANLPTTLQEMAYLFNANFCAAPVGHQVTFRKTDIPFARLPWCSNALVRESIVSAIKEKIPKQLFDSYMKDIIDMPYDADYSPSSKIVALHNKIWVCSIGSLDQVQPDKASSFNSCDRGSFQNLMWRR